MKRAWVSALAFAVLLALNALLAQAAPKVFYLNNNPKDSVEFTSTAQIEKIVGKTNKVRAVVSVEDLGDLMKGESAATVEVDLASLNTGNKLRDRDMREKFLETAKYPKAVFKLTKIESVQVVEKDAQGNNRARAVKGLQPGVPTRIIASGTLELHGKKNPVRFNELTVTYTPASEQTAKLRKGDLLTIDGKFRVKLTEYDIKKPQLFVLRIADDIDVEMKVAAGTGETKPDIKIERDESPSAARK